MLAGMFASPGQRALEGRLAELVAGRTVLAAEVANVETPGYRVQGASAFAGRLAAALTAQMGGAAPGTGAATGAPGALAPVPLVAQAGGGALVPLGAGGQGGGVVTPNGNGVGLDGVMAQVAKNDLGEQAVTRQLQLIYQNLQDAIG